MEIEYEKATSMTIEECEKEIMELDREILEKKQKRELLAQKRLKNYLIKYLICNGYFYKLYEL